MGEIWRETKQTPDSLHHIMDIMEVVTTMAEEEYECSFKTNVFIAAFRTTHAWLKL